MIDILVPVLGRPNNAAPLVQSVAEATSAPWSLLFLCSPADEEEIAACRAIDDQRVSVVIVPFARAPGDFARKTNLGFRETDEPWVFLGADDLHFHPGWDEAALRIAQAEPSAAVIGTNDLGNPLVKRGRLSTHSLVRRSYVEERGASLDGPGSVYHEGYDHNFVDQELCTLARRRGVFAFAHDALVEHNHPLWGKGSLDATYELSLAGMRTDGRLFVQRERLIRSERRVA